MKLHFSLAFLAISFLATNVLCQDVHSDYDKSAPFTRYHTYSWKKLRTSNPLWQSTVQDAVDKALAEKGWHKLPSGGDVQVSGVGATQLRQESQTWDDNLGMWRWQGYDENLVSAQSYKVAVFIVDLYDASNKHLIWQGTSVDSLSSNSADNGHNIQKAVEKMFRKFPPQPKK